VERAARNLGPSGARNLGLEAARAEVVAFLDSDDIYLPGRLSAALRAFAADASVVCVLSSARKFDRDVPREALVPDVTLVPAAFEWALICDLIPVEATSITVRRAAALSAGGFCPALRLTEDREFLIRLARLGGGRLIPDVLWEKSWSDDSLSIDWTSNAPGLIAYIKQRPEYLTRFPRLASYLASKVLVGHVRDRHYGAIWRDYSEFRAAGILPDNPLSVIANHRAVRRYRRTMANAEALTQLKGPPETWR
jgi:glycosyltransferase involved in cell wall biosynthesis